MNYLQSYEDEILDCFFSHRNKPHKHTPHTHTDTHTPHIITIDDLEFLKSYIQFGKSYSVCV